MFKKLLALVVVVIGALALYATTQPDTFRIERSIQVQAAPEKVFALIEDFHRWGQWSPWEKKDPAMKRTHSGAERGPGAAYAWEGNSDVGRGRMEILSTQVPSAVVIQLDFEAPMKARNTAEFSLQGKDGGTQVTWAMHGPNAFMGKVMSLFMDLDKMVGADFEAGLANLKAQAEQP